MEAIHPWPKEDGLDLDSTITGGKGDIEFRSSNSDICTVDSNGAIEAVEVGTCQIEARWAGDDDWEGHILAKIA